MCGLMRLYRTEYRILWNTFTLVTIFKFNEITSSSRTQNRNKNMKHFIMQTDMAAQNSTNVEVRLFKIFRYLGARTPQW